MSGEVTVRELAAFLASQPQNAPVRLAGVPDTALIGWTGAERTTTPEGTPVVLLAFERTE